MSNLSIPSDQLFSKIKILVLVHRATAAHRTILKNLFHATFPGAELTIADLHTDKIPSATFDLTVPFGPKAIAATKWSYTFKPPAVKNLEQLPENDESRAETYKFLLAIASLTVKPVQVTKLDFAAFSSEALSKIHQTLATRGKPYEGTTSTGKSICISLELDPQSTADINLTIEEVFAIKFLMDVMGVESINLTPIK